MTGIISMILLTAVFGEAVWEFYLKDEMKNTNSGIKTKNSVYIIAVMVLGAIAHLIAASCYYGHRTDMGCFIGWSDKIFKNGISQFYLSDGFHDYPPGYVYVMYILGAVKSLFKLDGVALQVFIKMPAMITDLVIGYVVYRFASKRFNSGVAAVFAAIIVFNPTTILNSAIWGQVDSILTLFCLLTVYFASEKKFIPAIASFAVGMLIKPQAFFVFPVLAFALIEDIWLCGGFDSRKLKRHLISGLCGVAAMFILFMPFGRNPIEGITVIVNQYVETLGQYNYMTVNAFNIFAALGKNWEALDSITSCIGYFAMAAVTIYSGYVFFKSKNPARYYISAFILFFGIFMFGVKMHERYAFPAIAMLIFAFVLMPNAKSFLMYGLFSLSQFFNTAWILFVYELDTGRYFRSTTVTIASVINLILCIVFAHIIQSEYVNYKKDAIQQKAAVKRMPLKNADRKNKDKNDKRRFVLSEPKLRFTRFDVIFVASIVVVYSAIALYNLGNSFAPQTELAVTNSGITVDLGETKNIEKTEFYLGARQLTEDRRLDLEFLDENKAVVKTVNQTSGTVFDWTIEDTSAAARYVRVSTNHVTPEKDPTDRIYLRELCFLDGEGNQLAPVNKSDESVATIFDEQHMMATGKTFMGGTYFDEIYHARTAYEFIHNMSVYEWTHPPLGKVLMGLGILLFGMVPFGWRIVGTVFGIFMIPVMYVFARRLLKHKWLAASACLLFTFDFMHFAQTRIATIDTYVTFFIMLMYYYMYKYYKMSFYDTPLKKTLIPLGLSGLFFGLAVASKWTGLYAGAGLAIVFFYTLYLRWREYNIAALSLKGNTNGIEHSHVVNTFAKNTMITILFCVGAFVIIPAIIYTLSYAPFWPTPSGHGIGTAFDEIERMWVYHSKTVVDSTHPYSSHWYEWPIMYRPIWYFSNSLENGLKQGISSFGNPAVWWVGIPAFAYIMALAIITPLRSKNYFGKSKWLFGEIYAVIFILLSIIAYSAGNANDKLERLFPCVVFYSVVMVGVFLIALLYDNKLKPDSTVLFLAIGYIVGLAPWVLVLRTTYIYHYFPSVPFVVLMIGYSIKTFYDNAVNKQAVVIGTIAYTVIALVLFAMFYPVLSGAPCDYSYAATWLKWFDSWVLLPK